MSTVLYILLALIVLLAMITVHEFGHYCAGKILGFKINEFSIGFGPAIFKRTNKKTGEVFAVRMLPLGGFCAFEGEDDTDEPEKVDKKTKTEDENSKNSEELVAETTEKDNDKGKDKALESKDAQTTAETKKRDYKTFNEMPAWKRLVVLLSGVSFNFLFGVLTAVFFLLANGFAVPKIYAMVPEQSNPNMLQTNDIIMAVDGKRLEAYRSFDDLAGHYGEGEQFTLTVNRDGKIMDVIWSREKYGAFYYVVNFSKFKDKLFDAEGNPISEYDFEIAILRQKVDKTKVNEDTEGTGLELVDYFKTIYKSSGADGEERQTYTEDDIKEFLTQDSHGSYTCIGYVKNEVNFGFIHRNTGMKYSFGECLYKSWPFCGYLCKLIFQSIGGLFTGATKVAELGGTVTAISQIAEYSSYGLSYFLLLLPLLSMNLALFNVLPIPALDGAKAVFVFIEMVFRKPVNRRVEAWIHTIGLFLLLGLVIFLDIYHFAFAGYFVLRL